VLNLIFDHLDNEINVIRFFPHVVRNKLMNMNKTMTCVSNCVHYEVVGV